LPVLDPPAPVTSPHLNTLFPRPGAIKDQIAFWSQIYSTYTTSQAVIHDSERLDIVYRVVDLPNEKGSASARLRRRFPREIGERYAAVLRHLAEGPEESELTELEREVRALWGANTPPAVFQAASGRVRSQLGQADRFRQGVQRAGAYLPRMQAIMTELGVPEELLAIPHVESSFNPRAVSHRGACGIWQWTRATARPFLAIDRTIDARRDPLLATRAAGLLLRGYYEELGSWPLAITAYNHGLHGVRRARAEHGTDIAAILLNYKGRSFKFASRNFYTEFLAALDVSRDHQKHFGELTLDPTLEFDAVPIARPVTFRRAAALARVSPDELAKLNPALLSPVTSGKRPMPAGYELRVPSGHGTEVAARLGTPSPAAPEPRLATALLTSAPGSAAAAAAAAAAAPTHRVRRGDTLGRIAQRYGTTVIELSELNRLDSDLIHPGQKLLVPATTQ
jgi:membrane-bound lytic murein transglycosylase D